MTDWTSIYTEVTISPQLLDQPSQAEQEAKVFKYVPPELDFNDVVIETRYYDANDIDPDDDWEDW